MRTTRIVAALLASIWGMGCASGYYTSYRDAEPAWKGGDPAIGSSLHETLAALHRPGLPNQVVLVTKLDVMKWRDGRFEVLTNAETRDALEDRDGTYGVVATQFCHASLGSDMNFTERVSWFLLPGGQVASYDSHRFSDAECQVDSMFSPGNAAQSAIETQLVSHRDAEFPTSQIEPGEHYRKGLAYVARGRTDDARRMLALGDAPDLTRLAQHDVNATGADEQRSRLVLAIDGVASISGAP